VTKINILKSIKNLSDRELVLVARKVEAEAKLRSSRRAAASAILAVLRKYKLSVRDLMDLNLGQDGKTRADKKFAGKRGRPSKAKNSPSKTTDKRAKVAFKYKNPKGSERWSGRGRTPNWVKAILAEKRISIAQFKADKSYKL
jgi:DNA-binding protein H-NS